MKMNIINNKNLFSYAFKLLAGFALLISMSACKETKSYSDLLKEEEQAVNWYLAQQRVVPHVPEDSVFEVGPDAPFYRMDTDGSVYMRVINAGDPENRPQKGQTVYFRFTRTDVKQLADGAVLGSGGSLEDDMSFSSWSLVYGNLTLPSSAAHGTGLQVPLGYLGYNCEVDLIVKSVSGRSGDISNCIPYLYSNLKYFKAEY